MSGFSEVCLVFDLGESLKLRKLPARQTSYNNGPMAVSINSSMVSLIEVCENRLEICKLELHPVPRLQTLCFLELPPLVSSDASSSHFFFGGHKEWVPTSKTYARTKSSRGYHLPFYSSAIGTIALHLYHYQYFLSEITDFYALIISVAELISAMPTDACNLPWESWGPSSTHLVKMPTTTTHLTPIGPFWITDHRSRQSVVRQYDPRRERYPQLMAEGKSLFQPKPPIVNSTKIFQYDNDKTFQYDIETRLPYCDVVVEKKDLNESTYILANREWVIGVTVLVCVILST